MAAAVFSLRWPLVGDASLMHYVVFLWKHGAAPYRDIVDVNLPGSYLAEAAAMRLFGDGALGWHLYDLLLLSLYGAAAVAVAGRTRWRGGLLAAGLFLLVHLQDGLAQTGQRDLLIAVLLTGAYAVLPLVLGPVSSGAACGLLLGATITIKPLFLPLGLLLLVLVWWNARQGRSSAGKQVGCAAAGLLAPGVAVVWWLWRMGSLAAFCRALTGLIPYHASLGRRPSLYLLLHAPAPLWPVVLCSAALFLLQRPRPTPMQWALLVGIGAALVAYIVQGKGYPYHRYPLLAVLLVLAGPQLEQAAQAAAPHVRWLALAAVAFICVGMAPLAAWRTASYRGDRPFEQALTSDLGRLHALQPGAVQCLDTFGGCINTLYDLRVTQATGFLYDCYLFTPEHDPVAEAYRSNFLAAFRRAQPRLIVITSQYCFGPDSFGKLDEWPQLREELARLYVPVGNWQPGRPQRWWSRREMPSGYRLYARRETPSVSTSASGLQSSPARSDGRD